MNFKCIFADLEKVIEMHCILKGILKLAAWILILPVYFYRYAISPYTPASCRHVPTCSEYAIQAIKIHGPFKGIWLGTRRILRCHPWGTHGFDPVPPSGEKNRERQHQDKADCQVIK